jgi:ABC-2 type transport system permease protein
MKKSLYTVYVFTKLGTRRFFRDRLALFFGIIFPLIFLFVFGGLFGKDRGVSFKVALVNESQSEFAKTYVKQLEDQPKLFKIDKNVSTLDAAKEKMNRGQLDATIVLPPDFGAAKGDTPAGQAKVYYTQNNQSAGTTLNSVLQEQFKAINQQFVRVDMPFTVTSEQTNDRGLSSFDYTFSGLLGFTIIGIGIFGPINVFPELKKQGILRRLHTTPLKVWEYFTATALAQAITGMVTMAILFAVAIIVFHLKVVGNPFEVALYLVMSIISILGMGLAIGGWAKNERQAAPLSNIIVFPMLFLSGTFFPRFLMPEWLQKASNFLPLTPVIDGIRLIATEGKHLTQIGPQVGMLMAWTVVIYAIAFLVFRWE